MVAGPGLDATMYRHRGGVMRSWANRRSASRMSLWSGSGDVGVPARLLQRSIARCLHERSPGIDEDSQVPIHRFTLIVDGLDLQDDTLVDAVFEAGCDDAAIARIDGIQYVDFDREAASLEHAILSAVADLKRIDGVEVVKIADPEHASIASIHGGRRTPGGQAEHATDTGET